MIDKSGTFKPLQVITSKNKIITSFSFNHKKYLKPKSY